MKKIKLAFMLMAMLFLNDIVGQQDPNYTQYIYTMNVLNPAYAGSKEYTSISILGRTQWVGVEGAPRTVTFSMHSPVGKSLGLGISAVRNQIGPVKEDNVFADFSYTVNISEQGRLAFGLKTGVNILNVRELNTLQTDPLNIPVSQTLPNFGVGTFYYTDNYYFGLSVTNLQDARHLDNSNGIVSTASEEMHYFMSAGYVFDILYDYRLKPSLLVRASPGAPVSVDLGVNLFIEENIELGIAHSIDSSISGMLAFRVNSDLRIGYSYDYTLNNFGNFNSGSHELMILFDFTGNRVRRLRCF